MARRPRVMAKSGIYHIILRGNNKQVIFEDDEDRRFFMHKLKEYTSKCSCTIYAYCLMDNHVHILARQGDKGISDMIKRLAGSYAYWFNRKYGRVGHLFQGRFVSEPVETKKYYITVLRYIHRNPVKAEMVKHCSEYQYCSYNEYVRRARIVDTDFTFSLVSKTYFINYHNEDNEDECLEMKDTVFRFLTDSQAMKYIKSVLPFSKIKLICDIDKQIRDKYIQLFRNHGLSIKQINRLTGISIGVISKNKLKYV